jgi:hypothetical protein
LVNTAQWHPQRAVEWQIAASDDSNVFGYPKSSVQDCRHGADGDWITATKNSSRPRIKVDHPDRCLVSGIGGRHGTFINAYDVFSSHWNAMAGEHSLVPLKLPRCRACLGSTDIRNVSAANL